mgnify:CR=1 FL=1
MNREQKTQRTQQFNSLPFFLNFDVSVKYEFEINYSEGIQLHERLSELHYSVITKSVMSEDCNVSIIHFHLLSDEMLPARPAFGEG